MIWGMTPADLTLVTPLNDVLALAGLPRVGLEHLALAQMALLGGDRVLAAVPASRRPRRAAAQLRAQAPARMIPRMRRA